MTVFGLSQAARFTDVESFSDYVRSSIKAQGARLAPFGACKGGQIDPLLAPFASLWITPRQA
jgi:hypothetical protein